MDITFVRRMKTSKNACESRANAYESYWMKRSALCKLTELRCFVHTKSEKLLQMQTNNRASNNIETNETSAKILCFYLSFILWYASARVRRGKREREKEWEQQENAERYLVTNIKATSDLIWSVCISFATAIFVCFWLVFVWIYALKSVQKKPSALLLLVGFGSFSRSQPQAHRNKRAYSNSNKWRRAQFMHALFEQTESKYLHCTCNSSTKLRFYSFSSLLYFLSVLFILVAGAAADAVVVVR